MEILYSYRESNPDSQVDRPVSQPVYWLSHPADMQQW